MTATERLFFAVGLPAEVRSAIRAALVALPESARPFRTAPPENWHVTVRFLGATTPAARDAVTDAVASATLPAPFEARISRWGAFPRPRAARVAWAGIDDPSGGLAALAARAESAARAAGFEPENRPYSPHITLGRLREPRDLRPFLGRLPPLDLPFAVDCLLLFRSRLGGGPARYEVVSRFPLPEDDIGSSQ